MTAHHIKEWDKAIEALSQSLKYSKPFESTVRKAYAMLAGSYLGKGDVQNAAQQIQAGLGLFPHDPELLFRAGIIYEKSGDLNKSEQAYLTLLTNRETGHIDSLDVSMTTYKAHHNLGALYQRMSRHADAGKQFRAAIQSNPQFAPSWLGLSEALRALGKHAEAQEALQH
jgi:tetratricopeptide (TPR) repeat protein